MPETTTRPRQRSISATAATNGSPIRAASPPMAAASVARTSRASASARAASTPPPGSGAALTRGRGADALILEIITERACAAVGSPEGKRPLSLCYIGPHANPPRRPMPQTLELILILLGAAVIAVVVCRQFRLPPILGYLMVGLAVGPHALAWVPDSADVRDLAEFGIVFLMFSIGLEFSLPQLKSMRRAVFGLGLAQVTITTAAAMLVLHFLGYGWQAGFALGGMLAMSSTAIVSKMLAERMELATPHGRDVMGILLFQDLAVVAFLIVIPSLGKTGGEVASELGVAILKAAAVLAVILFAGQAPMRAWFHLVARQKSSELFMLNLLLVTLGLAALTEIAGLSLALGAFLAGMLIAETEYRYQVDEDIKPFRDVLLGLFFVTVGMFLDPHVVATHWLYVLLLLVLGVLSKIVLVVILARLFRAPLGAALRTGFYLAQAGEFALVMLALTAESGLLGPPLTQAVLAAMVLSMLTAPIVIHFAEPVVRKLTANDWLARAAQITRIAATTMARQDHVIICGYGRSGQNLAR